jgi:predicted amidophosphoribosyltransferase
MFCSSCGFDNPSTSIYCKRCGRKIDYTYGEVHDDLLGKLQAEQEAFTEGQTRQWMIISLVVLALAVTAKVLFADWPTCWVIPASSDARSARFARVRFYHAEPVPLTEFTMGGPKGPEGPEAPKRK